MGWLTVVLHLGLGLLVSSATAQAPQDPLKDLCRRYGHQTAIIDRKLYIDGGWVYANPISQNPVPTINQDLIYSDLNQASNGMPTQYANLTKNSSVPDVAGGILWADEVNKVFWLYGGEYSTAPAPFQLWGYDTILNQWNMSTAAQTATSTIQRVSYGAGTMIGSQGYYYGGYLNNNTTPLWSGDPLATSTLVVLDLDSGVLSNGTGYDSIGRAEGVMVSIPASAAGMLVYFGGVSFPYGNSTDVAMDMTQIILYDIADAKWYSQTATGNIPANRRKFCAGVTWADDQSAYNIYVYGGFGFGENATGFDDVYILTIPTFEWIKWYPTTPTPSAPHGLLTCNVVDMAQMIVMGGNFTNTTDCDVPTVGGQHNLNLGQTDATNAKWYQYLPNLTDYSVPPAIISVAGGSSDGGATNLSPPNGFSDGAMSVYFGAKAQFTSRTPTRYIPAATGTASPTPTPAPKSKSNTGAIVGGVIGGVGGSAGGLQVDPNHESKNYVSLGAAPSGGGLPGYSYPASLTTTVSPEQQSGYQAPYQQYPSPQQQQFFMQQGNSSPAYPQQQYHQGAHFPPPSEMQGTSPPPLAAHEMPARGMTPGVDHLHRPVAQNPVAGIAHHGLDDVAIYAFGNGFE
ncbi:hypothetical protein DV736_g5478, partial [Chaetothyriales sp. CBS 134916]